MIKKIISGGQTGADMGGLLAAELLGIPRGGNCPEGFIDEKGFNKEFIPRFGLEEYGDYNDRTVANIHSSDATIVFAKDLRSSGTRLTIKSCEDFLKPYIIVGFKSDIVNFLKKGYEVINIAGNRESKSEGVQDRTRLLLTLALMPKNGIFVFGSNGEGKHGAGAAKFANDYLGAIYGKPSGIMGKSYAIITKKDLKTPRSSSLEEIREEVAKFISYAQNHSEKIFYLSEVGCGLAGYHYTAISKIFSGFSKEILNSGNIIIPKRFEIDYPVKKMMGNSSIAGDYLTLDAEESEYVREYYREQLKNKFSISEGEKFDVFLDKECKIRLCSDITRIVIGDHGPYIEFRPEKLLVKLVPTKNCEYKFKSKYKNTIKYFDMNPDGFPNILIYDQQRVVKYADYKSGMMYVSPDDIFIRKEECLILNNGENKDEHIAEDKVEAKEEVREEKKTEIDGFEVAKIDIKKENNENGLVLDGEFVHLHVHSEYSLLDGVCNLKELCLRAKELGQKSIALTDHGYMYGSYKFQKEASSAGIKAIHGVEAYFVDDALDKTQRNNYHIVLLVMNEKGWENICHLMTIANRDRFYYNPRVDRKLLSEFNEGLICTSACYKSPISFHLTEEGYDPRRARDNAMFFKNTFGDRFYNEVMHIGFDRYDSICDRILTLADELKLRTICTNDVHYVKKEDSFVHQTLMNMGTNGKLKSESNELFLKSKQEMVTGYVTEEMCRNTLEIADRIGFSLEFDGYKFPSFDITKQDDYELFRKEIQYGRKN